MSVRNFSINERNRRLAAAHRPRLRFGGSTRSEWQRWREELLPSLVQTLGQMPERVPLRPEVVAEWEQDGLVKQRVVFDVEPDLSVAAYVYRPAQSDGRKLPAILVCAGHGAFGKDSVMGNSSRPEVAAEIRAVNYDYGLKMAQAGFVTMAIDWRGFNDRDDRRKPYSNDIIYADTYRRDPCDVYYVLATMIGQTALGQNLHDARCAIDLLSNLPFVDPQRLGVMGLSLGGTMATWIAATDPRIVAASVICYSERFETFAMQFANLCGSQVTPGLYALCDIPDLQGLIAPRPLLVEIGAQDEGFFVASAMSCHQELEKIYAAAGAGDQLHLDLFGGHHRWNGAKTAEFFHRALGSARTAP